MYDLKETNLLPETTWGKCSTIFLCFCISTFKTMLCKISIQQEGILGIWDRVRVKEMAWHPHPPRSQHYNPSCLTLPWNCLQVWVKTDTGNFKTTDKCHFLYKTKSDTLLIAKVFQLPAEGLPAGESMSSTGTWSHGPGGTQAMAQS